MTDRVWERRAEDLRGVLDARGLPATASLEDVMHGADEASAAFLSSLGGYPHNMEEAKRQFDYARTHLLTPA